MRHQRASLCLHIALNWNNSGSCLFTVHKTKMTCHDKSHLIFMQHTFLYDYLKSGLNWLLIAPLFVQLCDRMHHISSIAKSILRVCLHCTKMNQVNLIKLVLILVPHKKTPSPICVFSSLQVTKCDVNLIFVNKAERQTHTKTTFLGIESTKIILSNKLIMLILIVIILSSQKASNK